MEVLCAIFEIGKNMWEGTNKWLGYISRLDENMQSLKRKIDDLSGQKDDIKLELASAELHPEKRRKKEVDNWLRNVEKIKVDVQRLEGEIVGERAYVSRAKLGKLIVEKIEEVVELQEKGRFSNPLVLDTIPSIGQVTPTPRFFSSITTETNLREVWAYLMDDGVRRIGIFGIGGVGKTTIMQHINNRLLKEARFDNVIWVTVSKAFNVEKFQTEIAKAIKLDLSDWSEEKTRASHLFAKLSEMKRYVLILDDLWESFPLEKVGLPEPTGSNGCKLVLTTRSLEGCRKMECTTFKVELLTEEEAFNLFMETLRHPTVLAPEVEKIAKMVAKECACLPLAIITIAGSMRGVDDIREWRNALNELTSSTKDIGDMETKVFERLKFSYSHLENENLQNCFLYAALCPEDHNINKEVLIKYWIAEGFIAEKESMQAMLDKGCTILNKLINVCLLEDFQDYAVKMHDLIRDMALKIIGPRVLVRAGEGLAEIPDEYWSEDLEKASFLNNEIKVLSCISPNCPRLGTLLLAHNPFYRIPDQFFKHMRGLRVLDLSYTRITCLPTSICELESLHSLLLDYCKELVEVASLEKLKALKEFYLRGTRISEVPQGIEELINLQTLDLSWNWKLEMFPRGKLSKLSQLQCLKIKGSRVKTSVYELMRLRKLKTLCIKFHDLQELGIYLQSQQCQRLEKYSLIVNVHLFTGAGFDKEIWINNREADGCGVNALMLPSNIEILSIEGCHDLISLSDILSLRNARDLRVCHVKECNRIESIFSSSSSLEHSHIPLEFLEKLWLNGLPNLRILFEGVAPPYGVYCHLKELDIYDCPNLKNIFSTRLLLNFSNLKYILVHYCENLENIIEGETNKGDHHNECSAVVKLPKLEELRIRYLPRLNNIYKGTIICGSLEVIHVYKCPMLRRLPSLRGDERQTSPPSALRLIGGEEKWWESLEWNEHQPIICLQPFFHKWFV